MQKINIEVNSLIIILVKDGKIQGCDRVIPRGSYSPKVGTPCNFFHEPDFLCDHLGEVLKEIRRCIDDVFGKDKNDNNVVVST